MSNNIHIELADRLLAILPNPNVQPLQLVSEMSELTKEIVDSHRGDKIVHLDTIVEEIGDVLNAIDTVLNLYKVDRVLLHEVRANKLRNYVESREKYLK